MAQRKEVGRREATLIALLPRGPPGSSIRTSENQPHGVATVCPAATASSSSQTHRSRLCSVPPPVAVQEKRKPEWDVSIPREPSRLHRDTAFLCNIRFRNDLPEVGERAGSASAASLLC
jgi:hypothetical protein